MSWRAGIAIVSVALAGGDIQAQTAKPRTIRASPSFEEDRDTPSTRYVWRNSGTSVSLSAGGTLSIHWQPSGVANITFVNARVQSQPQGEVQAESKTIYYLGPGKDWRSASQFKRVRYPEVYPGIDLVFVSMGEELEYNFEIAPNADAKVIRIHYDGPSFHLLPAGDLEMRAGRTTIRQRRPIAFQNEGERRQPVACAYRLLRGRQVALQLGHYDRVRPLFIDPVLDFSTFLGGSSFDSIYGAASDSQGNLYVTGETSSGSLSNPTLSPRSSRDAFMAKLNSAGVLVFTVYLGGGNYDSGRGIALDPLGNIYVTGVTSSVDFPVTAGSYLTHSPGAQDAFVAKFSPAFALQYSTYLGGGGVDSGLAIAVDSSGSAYVTGQTASTAFPVTAGAYQTRNEGGASDCFVSKLNPAGNALAYSTFLGGSGLDLCAGIAVDASGDSYVAGTTYSANFPVVGALQSILLGTANAFVTKLNATGSALAYSTYLGGSSTDNAAAIAVDTFGAAYVTGDTASFDFPTTAGVFQGGLNGLYNAFISKLSPAGGSLSYSTLLGGSGSDAGTSIAIDLQGRAIIGGYTTSFNFPTSSAVQATFQGAFDAFSTVLDPVGESLVFSSYFGGAGDDRGYAVTAATGNSLYLGGITSSSNFPVTSAIQSTLSVAPDAFILRVGYLGGAPAANSVSPNSGTGASQTFTLQYSDTAGAASLQTAWVYISATLGNPASNTCLLYYNAPGNTIELLQDNGATWLSVTPGAATTLQNSQCSLNVAGTSVVRSGNALTLNLPMTFLPAYAGLKNIYMYAADGSGANSGWQPLGTWTVPGASATPAAVSVTPSSGSAASQTFTLRYSDTAGAASLQTVWVYISATLANPASNTCLLYYNAAGNTIELLQDNGATWLTATPGAPTTLQNSQCSLNVAGTSVVRNGNALTLNLPMTFQTAYAGAKNIYLYAADVSGSNSGWQQLGTWTVPGASAVPVAVSVTPSSGSAASQSFAFQYSDTAGAASLQTVWVYISATLANPASNTCLLYYNAPGNMIELLQNNGATWLTATPGAATTLQNSQCSVNVAGTSVVRSRNTLTLNLPMTFLPAYAGVKNIYLYAADGSGANSGWQPLGTWTVPSAAGPAAISVTPSSGSVASQTFALQYSDTAGTASLQTVWVYFSATLANPATNTCLLYYNVAANLINLAQNSGSTWVSATPGTATTIQNSQCSLSAAGASVVRNGNTLTLNLPMTFLVAYAGAKNIYLYAADVSGSSSGWQQLGAWTVP